MHEFSNMLFSAEGKQAKEDDKPVSLGKNKKEEKLFLFTEPLS